MSSGTCSAWAEEEGVGEVLGERGGNGSGFCVEVLRVADKVGKVG